MDSIDFYRISKLLIRPGTPLRASFQLNVKKDFDASWFLRGTPIIELLNYSRDESGPTAYSSEFLKFSQNGKRMNIDIDTNEFEKGAYEIYIRISPIEEVQVPDMLLVTDEREYFEFAQELSTEEFDSNSPVLYGKNDLINFTEKIIFKKFDECHFTQDIGKANFLNQIIFSGGFSQLVLPSEPIRWACESIVDEATYIGLHGIKDFITNLFIDYQPSGLFKMESVVFLEESLDEKYEEDIIAETRQSLQLLNFPPTLGEFESKVDYVDNDKTRLKFLLQFSLRDFGIPNNW